MPTFREKQLVEEFLNEGNRWELAGKKFTLLHDKNEFVLVQQGTAKETKLKAKNKAEAIRELVKKGFRES